MAFVALLTATATQLQPSSAQEGESAEEMVWREAEEAGTSAAYEAYLQQYPLGRYTREAFRRAIEAAVAEQADGGSSAQPGAPVGNATLEDGAADAAFPPAEALASEQALWLWAQQVGSVAAFNAYLTQYPLGRYARDAFRLSVEADEADQGLGPAGVGAAIGGGALVGEQAYE